MMVGRRNLFSIQSGAPRRSEKPTLIPAPHPRSNHPWTDWNQFLRLTKKWMHWLLTHIVDSHWSLSHMIWPRQVPGRDWILANLFGFYGTMLTLFGFWRRTLVNLFELWSRILALLFGLWSICSWSGGGFWAVGQNWKLFGMAGRFIFVVGCRRAESWGSLSRELFWVKSHHSVVRHLHILLTSRLGWFSLRCGWLVMEHWWTETVTFFLTGLLKGVVGWTEIILKSKNFALELNSPNSFYELEKWFQPFHGPFRGTDQLPLAFYTLTDF